MPALRLLVTDTAQERFDDAITWLDSFSPQSARRFVERLEVEITLLCQQVAVDIERKAPLHPDELASIYYSRPVFLYLLRTSKTRTRRSNAGTWRIYYDLTDLNRDGQADTLRVLSVHHAAARPLWEEPRSEATE